MPKKLTQSQINSFNRITDSFYQLSLQHQKETENFNKKNDSMNSLYNSVKDRPKYDLSSQAQNYIVPTFITIITAVLIFGLIAIIDSQNAEKAKHKESLIDSLDY